MIFQKNNLYYIISVLIYQYKRDCLRNSLSGFIKYLIAFNNNNNNNDNNNNNNYNKQEK